MKKEKQEIQKKYSLIEKVTSWFEGISIQAKILILSFIILILGVIFIRNSDDKEILKALEESKKKTEEKLKSISLYQKTVDGYQTAINNIEGQIQSTEEKIEEIAAEKPEDTTLDKFFDKRI